MWQRREATCERRTAIPVEDPFVQQVAILLEGDWDR